jgi:hypothetical protein
MAVDVEVKIDGLPLVSSEEWAKAQRAPESDLPKVDPTRYIASRRLGLQPVDDARREYAWDLARESMRRQGEALAERLGDFLADVPGFRLRYVVWDGSRREWILVPDASSVRPVGITPDLVNRITDPRRFGGTRQDFEELSNLFGVRGAVA